MFRYFLVAALLVLAVSSGAAQPGGKKDEVVLKSADKLTADDKLDKVRNTVCKVYSVQMKSGYVYTIDMISQAFDSYLRLLDKDEKQLDEDDDGGGMLNARIVFNCVKDGEYKVVATVLNQGTGDYTLIIKRNIQEIKTGALVSKPAPDFRGDFAINGQPKTLADFKGKVVLLDFFSVRSGPNIAAFPKLCAWNKAYKDKGLKIVGLTFYQFEYGQKLAFDPQTKELKDIPKADSTTEQAMLKAFAAHHQLDHLLLALPKAEALKIFDAYAVNRMPQFVLIDRQGMVRAVRAGSDEQTTAQVESEIKKLLAEK